MKKTFLYMCVAAVLSVAFSSCLGDNETTTSAAKTFSVIKQSDAGVLYAVIYVGGVAYITGDGLTDVQAGDAALISYKVNLNNVSGSGIAKADYIAVNEVYPVASQKDIKDQPMDTLVNNNPFKAVSLSVPDQYMVFSNRWLFQFAAEVAGDQDFDVILSYDKDSQKDNAGNALAENTVIVDITLKKTGVAVEGATAKTKEKSVVVDFTSFRGKHTPETIATDGTVLKIWFRYIYVNPSTNKKELNYWQPGVGLGYWKS